MGNGTIQPKHWRGVRQKMSIPPGAETRRPRPLVIPIKWYPSDQPWIKVNTDGAYTETSRKAGGGGVVRDASGKLLIAFATPLQAKSALEAELMAMFHGLELAKEFGKPVWIESDSEQVVKLAMGKKWGPAHVHQAVAQLVVARRHHNSRVTFISQEGNKAADLFAKEGLEREAF
ncbi:uncharacterized protein LOC121804011 [Salvia splendens]|uniref:uncharacterized protein LOC121804011 n=1 Tax=Salvia splendens TaxID=180675 RepID=UPI001C2691B2|nr:uncharacterized protein LOC121804011 [Salvia splendens]